MWGSTAQQISFGPEISTTNWKVKVARYVAYNVNGGLLQSQFTLAKLIQMKGFIQEPDDELVINEELQYMLNIRKKGKPYQRDGNNSLDKQLKEVMEDYHAYDMNFKVLVVLIESQHV